MADDQQQNHDLRELPGKPRRAAPRHTLRRSVRVRCAQWDTYVKLYTANISRGGMLIRVPNPPEIGTEVQLRLTLPDDNELQLIGRVARIVPPKAGEGSKQQLSAIGVSLEVSPEQRSILDRYLMLAKASGDSTSPPPLEEERETLRPSAPYPPPKTPLPDDAPTPVPQDQAETIIGIDFGTSYCSVAIAEGNTVTFIEDENGEKAIPSVVWFRDRGDYVVGAEAREQMGLDPRRTIHSIKRLLGTQIDDPHAAPFLMSLACPGRAGPNRSIVFVANEEQLTPIQISAIILDYLKGLAEKQLGRPITKAVLACPLAFSEQQRADLEKAAMIAGLEIAALISEPAAAAMAFDRGSESNETIGVYDFGGGTFDFCLLRIEDGRFKVLSAAGDPWLGGDDLDQALAKVVADEFWRATEIDVRKRVVEWQRVLQACEEAKCYLSLSEEIDVYVPQIANTEEGVVDLSVPVTRDRFEDITGTLIDQTLDVSEQAIKEARVSLDDLSEILLIGGTSRVPAVRKAVHMIFRCDSHQSLHPEQAVVVGTAIKAAELAGAAVHRGAWRSLNMQQVAGRTVGLAMAGGKTEHLIRRSAPLPAVERRIFSTYRDNQRELTLIVVEGESPVTAENKAVGKFSITELAPAPAGATEIEVIFEMNESGALSITARDLTTGAKTKSRFEVE